MSEIPVLKFSIKDDRKLELWRDKFSQTLVFEYPVQKTIQLRDKLFVLLGQKDSKEFSRNIFCVSFSADVLWRVEKQESIELPFVDIINASDKLVARNQNGSFYSVDLESGQIIAKLSDGWRNEKLFV